MMLAVIQRDREIDYGESQWATLHILLHAVLDRRNVLPRDHAAGDLVDKLETLAAHHRLDLEMHIAEFAMAARLFLVPGMLLNGLADRLFIGNLRALGRDRDALASPAVSRTRRSISVFGTPLTLRGDAMFLYTFRDG